VAPLSPRDHREFPVDLWGSAEWERCPKQAENRPTLSAEICTLIEISNNFWLASQGPICGPSPATASRPNTVLLSRPSSKPVRLRVNGPKSIRFSIRGESKCLARRQFAIRLRAQQFVDRSKVFDSDRAKRNETAIMATETGRKSASKQ